MTTRHASFAVGRSATLLMTVTTVLLRTRSTSEVSVPGLDLSFSFTLDPPRSPILPDLAHGPKDFPHAPCAPLALEWSHARAPRRAAADLLGAAGGPRPRRCQGALRA